MRAAMIIREKCAFADTCDGVAVCACPRARDRSLVVSDSGIKVSSTPAEGCRKAPRINGALAPEGRQFEVLTSATGA